MSDPIHNPAHYTAYEVQPIEITRHLGFNLGNVVKYVLRSPYKGGLEDLDKAQRYLDFEAETPDAGKLHDVRRAVGPLHVLNYHLSRNDSPFGFYLREFMSSLEIYLHICLSGASVPRDALDGMRNAVRAMRVVMEGRPRVSQMSDNEVCDSDSSENESQEGDAV